MTSFLLLTQYFVPEVGAAPIRLFEVSRALRARGHAVTVVTGMPNHPRGRVFDGYRGKLFVRENVEGIPVIRTWLYPASGKRVVPRLVNYLSFTVSSVAGSLAAPKPEVVFVESPPLFLGMTGYLYARSRGIPYIFNVSDLWPDSARALGMLKNDRVYRLNESLELFLYRHAYRVNAVTHGVADALATRKGVPRAKILWLPNGVNVRHFAPVTGDIQTQAGDKPIFSFVGTHGLGHGLDVVLDAAHIVGDRARFLMVGDGSDKARLVDRARRLGLTNVTFLDSRPYDEVPAILAASRGALVTVRSLDILRTARSAKLFPAMASALPVIYAADDEGSRLVQQAEAGIVVSPDDAEGVAAAVLRLAADPELARRLGANGRALVEREYSWDIIVDHWLDELRWPNGVAASA